MKNIFLLMSFFLMLSKSNSFEICYPLLENKFKLTAICAQILDDGKLDSNAIFNIMQGNTLVYSLNGRRIYRPERIICSGKEHDCHKVPSSVYLETKSLGNGENGIEVDIKLWLDDVNKCQFGNIKIVDRPRSYGNIMTKCPEHWWSK